MNSTPLVSVVMSVYNGERYLREAVDSVLQQSFSDFEFIIVDDGSTDCTAQILSTYTDSRFQILHNSEQIGQAASLNRAIKLAQGCYIARQDADDISEIARLSCQVDYMEKHQGVVLLGTGTHIIDANGNKVETYSVVESCLMLRWHLLFSNPFIHTSVMIRRADLASNALLYEDLPYSQDYDLWSRIERSGCIVNLPDPLVRFRRHAGSKSASNDPLIRSIPLAIARNNQLSLHKVYRTDPNCVRHMVFGRLDHLTVHEVPGVVRDLLELYQRFLKREQSTCCHARGDQKELQTWIANLLIRRCTQYANLGQFGVALDIARIFTFEFPCLSWEIWRLCIRLVVSRYKRTFRSVGKQ